MSTWITVPQAALMAGRSEKTIYRWIRERRLSTVLGESGRNLVSGLAVMDLEATVTRGRPRTSRDTPEP